MAFVFSDDVASWKFGKRSYEMWKKGIVENTRLYVVKVEKKSGWKTLKERHVSRKHALAAGNRLLSAKKVLKFKVVEVK